MAVTDWKTFERTYGRLTHEARRLFDVECAESVIHLAVDPRIAALLAMRRAGAVQAAIEPVRDELYRVVHALHGRDDWDGRIEYRVGESVLAATDRLWPNLANSDYPPRAYNEANDAIYCDVIRKTNEDSDAADHARLAFRERMFARMEALLANPPPRAV